MTITIGSSQTATALPSGIVEETRGNYRGETVTLDLDINSQLEDLVEEIGMAIAYRGDRRLLERRKLRYTNDVDAGYAGELDLPDIVVARLAKYKQDLPQLPDMLTLQRLFERLLALEPASGKGGSDGNSATLRDGIVTELAAYDPDVTHQYAALDLALVYLEGSGADQSLYGALRDVQAGFEEGSRQRDVRAGLAAALPASQGAAAIGADPGVIRSTYRMMIAGVTNVAGLFQLLRKFDLTRSFNEVVAIFTRAAARDLSSTGPSTDRDYIRALMVELGRLRKAKSVVLMAAELMRTTRRHLNDGEKVDGNELDVAGDILTFAGKATPGLDDARALMNPYRNTSLAAQLVFANGLRDLHGELPVDVCLSSHAHLMQNAAILHMLDRLVEAEDRAFQE